ncbi:MAG: hypothetical protein HYV32_00590 [Candidatus Kerfeldbacteria bacterium]|nr:hypothetical protein [Candidatus Kerfeldbacteria bacterium]
MKFFSLLCSITLITIAWSIPNRCVGIGISPSQIKNDLLVSDSSYTVQFALSDSGNTEESTYQLVIDDTIASIVSIEEGTTITLPADSSSIPFHVHIQVPAEIVDQQFSGNIYISKQPSAAPTHNDSNTIATLMETLAIPVELTIQQHSVTAYTVTDIMTTPQESGWEIPIFYTVRNTGNVPAAPTHISIVVTDMENEHIFMTHDAAMQQAPVSAFSDQTQFYLLSNSLDVGNYLMNISITDAADAVSAERQLLLEILPPESIAFTPAFALVTLQGEQREETSAFYQNNTPLTIAAAAINNTSSWIPTHLIIELRDGDRVVQTREMPYALPPQTDTPVTDTLTIIDEGRYTLAVFLRYPGGESPSTNFSFRIADIGKQKSTGIRFGSIIGLCIVLLILYFWVKRRKSTKKQHPRRSV